MKVFYEFSTHWDREWYVTFQEFRYKLVKMIDGLIDTLENNKIDVFTFDGQTIILEDYLEIRPEMRERLEALIKSGKLVIGPWYIMPDEFSVSGESIIRNFLVGQKICKSIGVDAWKYGYMCDIFGHIAQMPQILQGFGIDGAYLGRGVGGKNQNFRGFVWRAPDGSECMAYKQTYADLMRVFKETNNDYECIIEFIEKNAANDMVILNYTDDHAMLNERSYKFFDVILNLKDKFEVVEGIEKSAEHLKKYYSELSCVEGELTTPAATKNDFRLAGQSISSYYILKKANDECERLLESTVSPMLVISDLKGKGLDKGFYNLAYKYLLKNQPHDSICGCSIDRVHMDMEYRYSQVKSISKALSDDFAVNMGRETAEKDRFYVKVFNFGLKKTTSTFMTDLIFEKNWPCKVSDNSRYQKINSFEIFNDKGERVPYQIIDIKLDSVIHSGEQNFRKADVYRVEIDSELIPFGYSCFAICGCEKTYRSVDLSSDNEMTAENEYIKIDILPDGSVKLTDKETGKEYKNLCTFVEDGEAGNGWFSERPMAGNRKVSSTGAETTIEKLCDGALVSTFRVTKGLVVPKALNYANMSRTEENVKMQIVTYITLKAKSRELEFKTVINNNAYDHRVRVFFPTQIKGETYYASQAFCFNERARGVSSEGAASFEPEIIEKNMSGIVTVCDNENSLSFIGKEGFHECAVDEKGNIAVTLFRSHGRAMFVDMGTEYAQMNGELIFEYTLSINKNRADLFDVQKYIFEKKQCICTNEKADSESLMCLSGDNIVQSIVKPSENGIGFIVRLFNPSAKIADGMMKFNFDIKNAYYVNLSEKKQADCVVDNNKVKLAIEPNKITTLYIEEM